MPQAFYISSALADLSVDVSLSSVARGDVLYRGATKWNNLAHGVSGQFLKTNGVGADPSWGTVDLTTLATLAPGSVDRNLIQPTADTNHALVLKNFSGTQSAAPLEWRDSSNNVLGDIGPAGVIGIGVASEPGFGLLVKCNSASQSAIEMRAHTGSQSANMIIIRDINDVPWFTLNDPSIGVAFEIGNPDAACIPFELDAAAGQTASLILVTNVDGTTPLELFADSNLSLLGDYELSRMTTAQQRVAARMSSTWATSTDASRAGRGELYGEDFGGSRLALRWESSGSAAMIGFLGAAAAAQQSLPVAATDPATTQALANALRSLAITFGLGA